MLPVLLLRILCDNHEKKRIPLSKATSFHSSLEEYLVQVVCGKTIQPTFIEFSIWSGPPDTQNIKECLWIFPSICIQKIKININLRHPITFGTLLQFVHLIFLIYLVQVWRNGFFFKSRDRTSGIAIVNSYCMKSPTSTYRLDCQVCLEVGVVDPLFISVYWCCQLLFIH